MKVGVDIVVTNYRTPDDLAEFMASIDEHSPDGDYTVTIMNVAPLAEDITVGRRWNARHDGRIVHCQVADNIGYARACNMGAAFSTHDVVALFNADVVLNAGAINECATALRSHPEWGILGPKQTSGDVITHGGFFGTEKRPRPRGFHSVDRSGRRYVDIREDAVTVAGSAYFIKRALWDQLTRCQLYQTASPGAAGAFLPTPHYYEETFCSVHARAHGYRCVYYGPVSITHKWHRASPINGPVDLDVGVARALFRAACDIHKIPHD